MILFRDHRIIYISYNHSYNFGTGLIIPRCQSDIESLDKLLSYYTEGQLIHLSTTNKATKCSTVHIVCTTRSVKCFRNVKLDASIT